MNTTNKAWPSGKTGPRSIRCPSKYEIAGTDHPPLPQGAGQLWYDKRKRGKAMHTKGTLRTTLEVFWVALKLGLTSFGGPSAHLGYFHEEYVRRRKWLDAGTYADLIALCQFLPGP